MTEKRGCRESLWDAFPYGLREGAQIEESEDDGEGYDPFAYAPGSLPRRPLTFS
jgi:hypothetical protein